MDKTADWHSNGAGFTPHAELLSKQSPVAFFFRDEKRIFIPALVGKKYDFLA